MSFTQFNTQDMFKTVKVFNPKATEGLTKGLLMLASITITRVWLK